MGMNAAEQRAANRAANKLLRTADYNPQGSRLDITKVRIKPETPIDYPEGLSKKERKEYRKQVLLKRGEGALDSRGQLVTAVEQKIRRARREAPVKKQKQREHNKAQQAAKKQAALERRIEEANAVLRALREGPRTLRVVKRAAGGP